jgi:hypothetical protein
MDAMAPLVISLPSRLVLSGVLALAVVHPGRAQDAACPDPAALTEGAALPLSAVRYLADDALGGRLAGSAGEQCAGAYIAAEFQRLGLRPAGEAGGYFQSLPLASSLNPHAPGGTGRNVIGALPGADPALADEWVVVGAHYDHLGEGGPNSLAPNTRAIHNGADDNASGVAAMLAAAERLAAGPRPARSLLFIAFTGEESGLLGSAYFAGRPTVAPGRLVAMINLDMVGRLGEGPLIVYGVDTAEEWRQLVEPAAAEAGVRIATRGEGYGPSDHTSFYLKDVPVLHLFTNTHGDYHKPTDDWQKVDGPGLARVTAIVTEVARGAASSDRSLTLVRGAGRPPVQGQVAVGYGAYLGSVPDFTPVDRGVKLSGVTPGSPADTAGIQAGDVSLGIGEHDVADLQAMTDALRAHKPGDTVTIRLARANRAQTVEVTLGSRAAR